MGAVPNPWLQLDSTRASRPASSISDQSAVVHGRAREDRPTDAQIFKYLTELKNGADCSPATKAWLQCAAQAIFDTRIKDTSFEAALGLSNQSGSAALCTRMRLMQSRQALQEALQLVGAETNSAWGSAKLLSDEIKTFKAQFWPDWSRLESAPRGSSALRRALFSAFKAAGGKVPASSERLYALLVVRPQLEANI